MSDFSDKFVNADKAARGVIDIEMKVTDPLTGRAFKFTQEHDRTQAFCRYRDIGGDMLRHALFQGLGARGES